MISSRLASPARALGSQSSVSLLSLASLASEQKCRVGYETEGLATIMKGVGLFFLFFFFLFIREEQGTGARRKYTHHTRERSRFLPANISAALIRP